MRETVESFKTLSVDKRIKIIELLKRGSLSVNALAEKLGISQSAVSQHLRVLKQAGLVKDERKGYWIYYSLDEETLRRRREDLIRVCSCGCLGLDETTLGEERKALREYRRELLDELKRVEKKIEELER